MKKIEAYEAKDRIFRTKEEARKYELGEELQDLFRGKDGRQVLVGMLHQKEIRDRLITLFRNYDHREIESKAEKRLKHCREIVENVTDRSRDDARAMSPDGAILYLRQYFERIERSEKNE